MKRTVLALLIALGALAQTSAPPNLVLRGDRFRPIKWEEMTPAQKTMINNLLSGERGTTTGPFNVLLRDPEVGDQIQKFGAQMRFHSSIPRKLNEFAILITARFWTSQYEWYAHRRDGLKYGLEQPLIDSLASGTRPSPMDSDEAVVYSFCQELLTTHHVSDATFKAAVDRFTERGVVDLIATTGYYNMVSMILNTDRYPLPDGIKPMLK